MARYARGLVVTLGFVLLGLFVTMVPQKTALGQNGNTQPVFVTNKTVPTTVTNFPATQNVNVTNAALPVMGTVNANINGTPTVSANITNSPLSALITNPMSNPVIAQDADNAARNSFGAFGQCNFSTNSCSISQIYLVPAGKIAVLTTISGVCSLRSGDTLDDINLSFVAAQDPTTDRQATAFIDFAPGPGSAAFGFQQITFTQSLNVYAWSSPNTPRIQPTPFPVNVRFTSPTDETNSGAFCTATLFGHLVSEPQIQ